MYKFIGIGLICISLGGFFWKKAQTLCQKYENLKEILKAVTHIKQELSFSSVELAELMARVCDSLQGNFGQVLKNTTKVLADKKTTDMKSAWEESGGGELLLTDEARKITEDYFFNIGKKSLDIELEKTEKTIQTLSFLEKEEREKTNKDKKLLYTMGASVAAAIVILVI